jgi:hypothetical protein
MAGLAPAESLVRQQLEFYFGDANLTKDKWLRNAIDTAEGGFVSAQVIADFNKMKQLCDSDVVAVLEAARGSSLLDVSGDGKYVRRKAPLPTRDDADDRTIFVEPINQSVTHDALRSAFSSFGEVVYVSIPRHKEPPRACRGHAFIEFKSAEQAGSAVKMASSTAPRLASGPLHRICLKVKWLQSELAGREATAKPSLVTNGGLGCSQPECVVHFTNGGSVTRHVAKEVFATFGHITYFELKSVSEGKSEGWARYESARVAAVAAACMRDRKQRLGGLPLVVTLLDGKDGAEQAARMAAASKTSAKLGRRPEQHEKRAEEQYAAAKLQAEELKYEKGLIVRISELPVGIEKAAIQKIVGSKLKPAKYVDVNEAEHQCYVRMGSAEETNALLQLDPQLFGPVAGLHCVEAEEERKYWAMVLQNRAAYKKVILEKSKAGTGAGTAAAAEPKGAVAQQEATSTAPGLTAGGEANEADGVKSKRKRDAGETPREDRVRARLAGEAS